MHCYDGQTFDGFRSVKDAERFIVSVEKDKDFDYNRLHCIVLDSLTYPHMFMVVVQRRIMTLEERERVLHESCF